MSIKIWVIIAYFGERACVQALGRGGTRERGKVDAGMERFSMLGWRVSPCYVGESLHARMESFSMLG